MTGGFCYSIGISVITFPASMGSITISCTGGSGYDRGVAVSLCGDIYNIFRLGGCPRSLGELCRIGCRSLAFAGCRSLYLVGNNSGCVLDITAVTLTACGTRLTVIAPGVFRIAVTVLGDVLLATDVTVVIVVGSYIGTGLTVLDFTATVVTYVVFVGCGVFVRTEFFTTSVFAICAIVAIVILVSIFAGTVNLVATIVAIVVLIGIVAGTVNLVATVVTIVVLIGVLTLADLLRAAIVTDVVLAATTVGLLFVGVGTEVLAAAILMACTVVTVVIRVGIYTLTDC